MHGMSNTKFLEYLSFASPVNLMFCGLSPFHKLGAKLTDGVQRNVLELGMRL
jgi:hypothetical protein